MKYTITNEYYEFQMTGSLKDVYRKIVSDLRKESWLDSNDLYYGKEVSAYTSSIMDSNRNMICQVVCRLWEIKGQGYIRTITTYRIDNDGYLINSCAEYRYINIVK